jgi:cytochrome c-type biogenesis protein CcmH/NrfG
LATPVTPATDPAKTLADGRKRYEDGAWPEAVADLESVVAAEPDNAEALGYLGAVYYQQKRIPESIAAYERYVSLVPSDLRTQEFLGEMKRTGGTGK